MPTQYVVRRSGAFPATGKGGAAPIFVDSDTDALKIISGGEGSTTEFDVPHGGAAASLKGGLSGADTAALVLGGGTSASPLLMGSTAGQNLLGFWASSAATSGDSRLFYTRLYFTGAGVSGETQRIFASISDVAAATVRGAHISLSQGDTGSVTGLGTPLETTLHINGSGSAGGTLYGMKSAINSDDAASDPAGATTLAYFGAVNQGNATGAADVDDDAVLFHIDGHTVGDGNMVDTAGTEYALSEITHGIKVKVGSTILYLLASTTAPDAT